MARSRQLVAIMFTDIQGYTTLMQKSEELAVQAREKHRRIFNSVTEKYEGKILQYYGDGTLSIFNSAIDAVNCGIEMQHGFREEPIIPVRIGIHTGDIIFSDEEIIGDGVNIASRIESLAIPGSILISAKVFDEIKNQKSIHTSILKTVKLKNVKKPIEVYAISNEGLIVPKPENIKGEPNADSSQQHQKSIAVLAFENMSGDAEQEYFSDGISEEILNSLVKIEGLKVAGRTSAFSFKGKNEDLRTIGKKLDVQMVLEGSVRKAGNKVRITAQLINVDNGFHLWSETYNRELDDIFAVQDDIANRISKKFKLHIQKDSKSKSIPQNTEAYELLLKGSYFFKKGYEYKQKALEYFQMAVELDPNYAEAHAFIGETYLQLGGLNRMSPIESTAKARMAANKAISLNEQEPHAHKVLAFIYLFNDWDWEATSREYNRAVECGLREQNDFISYYYIFLHGDYEKAISVSQQMIETDPLHVDNHWQLGLCYYFAKRFEDALASFNNALELDANYSACHHWKGVVLGYLGKFDEALHSLEKAMEITGGETFIELDLIIQNILKGEKVEALQKIRSLESIDEMEVARLYSLLNMPNESINLIEKSYRKRLGMMVTLKHYWVWDPLRNNPRFIEIYDRMNF